MRSSLIGFRRAVAVGALLLAVGTTHAAEPAAVTEALKTIQSVSREGTGNEAAATAWKALVAAGPEALIPTLTAFDTASKSSANWLRSAIDAIAEAERKAKKPLPVTAIEAFVKDTKRHPAARRIAFELYSAEAKDAAAKLLPTLIDDPSVEIRREAVASRLTAAGDNAAKDELLTLFNAARDQDQIEDLAKRLEKLGAKQDVTRHYGFITEWHVVGPFDSTGGAGYAKSFAPESKADLATTLTGKGDARVAWKYVQGHSPDGQVDLNEFLGKHKDAVAYALAIVEVAAETNAEIRFSSLNAVQAFVNGKKVFEHEEYHHGANHDQYVGKCVLKAGRNEILLKLCQNNQTESWAQEWMFAARICDATGGKIPVTQVLVKDGQPTKVTPGALKPAPKKDETKEKK